MRTSRWGYAILSTLHVLGIALLIGAITTLDLRLIGLWPRLAVAALAQSAVPVAATGLALAITAGLLLFLAAPADYLQMRLFLLKLALIGTGIGHALWVHATGRLDCPPATLRRIGLISLFIWLAVLICGRMLAFTD